MSECGHEPGLLDKAKYYAHIVWGHTPSVWREGAEPDAVQKLCLTYDWLEYGTECPRCIARQEAIYGYPAPRSHGGFEDL